MGTEERVTVFFSAAPFNVGIAGDLRSILTILDTVFCCVADYFGEFVARTLDRPEEEFEVDQCGVFPVECVGKHHFHGGCGGINRLSVVSSAGGIESAVLDVIEN